MTRREQLFPEIRRLREDEGLMWREIGERLGLAKSTVHDYYTDPTGEASNERNAAFYRRRVVPCPRCGEPMSPAWFGYERCGPCYRAELKAECARRVEEVAALYNAGKSHREIAAALGYSTVSSPGTLLREARRCGLIGYRNRGYDRQDVAA